MRAFLLALVAALAVAAATAPAGGATNECQGIQKCISVPGPWVVVPPHGNAEYLLTCPKGQSIVGGLDAQVTSRTVHVTFEDAQLGAPVGPGITTTKYALFRAVSTSGSVQSFQPFLGCIPVQGGGGRSTTSARTVSPPGQNLDLRSRIVVIGPGDVKFTRVGCAANETLIGGWDAIAFRTKKPPSTASIALIHAHYAIAKKQVVVTASATDALSADANAIVQAGAECAPNA
ncbi:MAG TPA: hypothetical protein VFB25_12410 [Gaiellaceae bacterium]|nr:hypothetical protein [Gaiellaceae bacterium]